MMLKIFGGQVKDLQVILREERIPEGWKPRFRKPHGLALASLNKTVLSVGYGTRSRKGRSVLNTDEGGTESRCDKERIEKSVVPV